jgi:2-dehydropantoate 2-reductase
MESYAVIGPGAVGCFITARLAGAGFPVTLVDHDPARARRLAEHGIILAAPHGRPIHVPVICGGPLPAGATILICVKSHALAGVLAAYAGQLTAGRAVAAVQNGLAWVEALAGMTGPATGGIVAYCGVHLAADRTVVPAGDGPLRTGALAAAGAGEFRRIAGDLRRAGFAAEAVDDIRREAWTKLIVNLAINPLTVIHGCPNGGLLDGGPRQARLEALAREGAAVATAEGIGLDAAAMAAEALATCRRTAVNISSTLQDVRAGRPTELDAILGHVVRRGAARGVPVPVAAAVLAECRAAGTM